MLSTCHLENCNRCCSDGPEFKSDAGVIVCSNCGFSQPYIEWQLRGWRSLEKYPPHFGGDIYVYGESIGRVIARWDRNNSVCSNPLATHWLKVPDPRVQIDM